VQINTTVDSYINGVMDGTVVVGAWIKKAIQRHLRDLERTDIWFDPAAANDVIDFCQFFCIPSAQHTPIVLMPWQQAFISILYGWKRLDGTRRFRRAYLEIAKKNGKTGLAAALSLYHLLGDGEEAARVFIAATALKQARECFHEAVAMRDHSPELQALINKNGNSPVHALYVPKSNSRLSPMTRGSDSQDGAVVSAAILDELHRWKLTDNLWSILRYGGDTRTQPMLICITTAGASEGKSTLCWSEHEYGCKILDRVIDDDEICPFIFSLDLKDDFKDPKNWIKPNPSLGAILPLSALENQFREAEGKPTAMGEYKRYRLNIWSDQAALPAIDIDKWDLCCVEDITTHPDPKRLRKEAIERLKGRLCFGGFDYAPQIDTSSLVLLFPPLVFTERWSIIEYFWCPEAHLDDRVKRDRVPYDVWRDDGFIVPTPGNLTDPRYITGQFAAVIQQFNVKEIAYDAAWASEVIRMLAEEQFPMEKLVPFPQTHLRMNAPCQELMRKLIRQEFAHTRNPVMRWQMGNLKWNTQHGTNFIKPDKLRDRDKIDGCTALVQALGRSMAEENLVKVKKPFFVVTSK